jgi:hypothetical protein
LPFVTLDVQFIQTTYKSLDAQRTAMATPYRSRIVEYCQRNGIVVPSNFDAPKSSDRLVLVDFSASPPQLHPRSTYLKKELIKWGLERIAQGKTIRFYDFKRQCELLLNDHRQLVRGETISALSAEERRQLEWRQGNTF